MSPSRVATISADIAPPARDLPRLGFVLLSTDLTTESDAARLIAADEAVLHSARIAFHNPATPAQLQALGPDLARTADLLAPGAGLAAICFACTSASVTLGDAAVARMIHEARPGVPVVTPSHAALAALSAMGVRRVALLTPYLVATTEPMAAYFEENGLTIIRAACFDLADDRDMARVTADSIVAAAVALDSPEVEAVFISCTALPAAATLARIEAATGKPAVSSNQAALWAMRALAGLTRRPKGAGRLFDHTPSKDAFAP